MRYTLRVKKHHAVVPLLCLSFLFGACAADESDDPSSWDLRDGSVGEPEVLATFNPAFGETPESVALDADNNAYVSLALTGEIRKVTPEGDQSTLAFIPLGPPELCQGPFPGIMGALAIDVFGHLYVGAAACDPANKGIWRIEPDGDTTLIASLPPESLPNGIAVRAGRVYVADSGSTKIWRAPTFGQGEPAEVWTDEPLLADPNPFDPIPGANGLQFYLGSVYVANAGAGTIVEIPFEPGGLFGGDLEAQPGSVKYGPADTNPDKVTPPEFPGCDDFAFDLLGRIYCATDPFQTLLRINLDGSVDTILTAEDGLDGPTAAAFGRQASKKTLYITNAQFPFFPPTGNGPSLMTLEVDVRGYPFR